MRDNSKIREYLKKHRLNTVWRRLFYGAASVVVFVTTYMLILPAITVETATDNYYSVVNSVSGNGVLGNSVSGNSVSGNSAPVIDTSEHTVSGNTPTMDILPVGIEKPEDWEQITGRVELTGDHATDVVAIAKTQLGYEENLNYYYIDGSGTKRGYTRYGEWYGEPYREWSALFVSFCLHYAGVEEAEVPRAADAASWMVSLSAEDCGRYRTVADYIPYSGDLVFLDWNEDGAADQVAIIDVVVMDENGTASALQVIEGDFEDRVQYREYSLQGGQIVGYGQIAQQGAFYEKSYTDGSVIVTASYTKDAKIPEEAELLAYRVTQESAPDRYEQRQQDMQEILEEMQGASASDVEEEQQEYLIYNIGFYVDGEEIEPADNVTVTLQLLSEEGFTVGDPIAIVHFAEDGAETLTGMEMTEGENGGVSTSFETTGFSDYGIMPLALVDGTTTWIVTGENDTELEASFREAIAEANAGNVNEIVIEKDFSFTTVTDNGDGTKTYTTPGLNATQDVTIDLNGCEITVEGTLVNVGNGATLIIVDSQAEAEEEPKEAEDKNLYGNAATYDPDTKELTYYVTEVISTDVNTGATVEKLYEHKVTGQGVITGTSVGDAAIYVSGGGTVVMRSGMIAGCAQRGIYAADHGTLELEGGYLCGNSPDFVDYNGHDGGAIYANNGSLVNLTGTVIAANKASYGGAIHVPNSVMNISGGVISGNIAAGRGGGIDTWNGTINMTGGYITNNISQQRGDYYAGGGGILLRGDGTSSNTTHAKFIMDGGFITGNSAASGGGIYTERTDNGTPVIVMKSGYVTHNYAEEGEGGGIRIDLNGVGTFTGGHITNNITNTAEHWGGGGLFIADGASCQLTSVLVTENNAGGYGGGVAGCSTGRIYVSAIDYREEGAAIFANTAEGTTMSGTGSAKQEDHLYAQRNDVFKQSGYADYFCMLYSNVTDSMLGGGSENWKGSIDGVSVTIPADESAIGNSATGLTSWASDTDRAAAMNNAQVFINGNDSNTHGGGILCNGYMVLGAVNEGTKIDFGTRLELFSTKEYYDLSTGEKLLLTEGDFTFRLTEEASEVEMARAVNDSTGALLFDKRLTFDEAGTYRYILTEVPSNTGIITDETKYRLTIQVGERVESGYVDVAQVDGTINEVLVKKTICHFVDQTVDGKEYKAITVEKLVDGATWEVIREIPAAEAQLREEGHAVEVSLIGEDTLASFVNYKQTETSIKVVKEWANNEIPDGIDSVMVTLFQNGTAYAPIGQTATTELSAGNGWTHTWTGLPITDGNGTYYEYTVKENVVDGYLAEYEYFSSADSEAYWVPADSLEAGSQYIILSPEGAQRYALWVSETNKGEAFTEIDTLGITADEQTSTLTVGGTTYNRWYDASAITDNKAIFIAQAHKEHILLKSSGYDSTWLVVYSNEAWGSCYGNVYEASFFEYSSSLQGRQGGNNAGGALQPILYDSGANLFGVLEGESAQLYKLVRKVLNGATTVTITNTPVNEASFSLDLTKYAGSKDEIIIEGGVKQVLAGAEFAIYKKDGDSEIGPLRFSVKANGDYQYEADSGDIGTSVLVTDADGRIEVVGMSAGQYILRETRAPEGYWVVEDQIITLDETTENGVAIYELIDNRIEFELPKTGGEGNFKYTLAGLLLFSSATYLLYKKQKRRREAIHSP